MVLEPTITLKIIKIIMHILTLSYACKDNIWILLKPKCKLDIIKWFKLYQL